MQQVEWLDLPVWDVLKEAATEPEDADLALLWQEVEAAIVDLDCPSQLSVAGEAIVQITDVFEARSQLAFEEIQAAANVDGPVMPEDAFDRYVRQTMQVDFDQYIEPLISWPRKAPQLSEIDSTQSFVAPIEQQALIKALEKSELIDPEVAYRQAMALAHDEDVFAWVRAISNYFIQQQTGCLPLVELVQKVQYPEPSVGKKDQGAALIKTWLAVLLGGFRLEQQDFYDLNSIRVWMLVD